MKKLLAFMLATIMVLSCGVVMAEKDNCVEGTLVDNTLTVTYNEGEKGVATLTIFDDGVMCGVKSAHFQNDCYTFELSDEDVEKDMKIYFYGEETYPVTVTTPAPTETPTEIPTETPTPKPTRTPYPEAYEKAVDAINAPAIVSDVSLVQVDGERYHQLKMWYQGQEITTNVRETVVIESAPGNVSYLVGKTTNYLQTGDIIHFTCDLQGRVRSIEFIYRPEFIDYFPEGVSVNNAIGSDGSSKFVFGVAVETYTDAMEIMDSKGNICELDVSPYAFVYNVSNSRKGAVTELYGKGAKAVPRVHIPDRNLEGEALLWEGMEDLTYVLARVSRDVVTDIIVFK